MSEVLENLHASPSETPAKSWAQEVADAGAAEAAAAPVAETPAPSNPETPEPAGEAPEPQETAPEQDRRVPLKALQEERQKRAEYERMLQEREQQLQQWQAWAAQQQQMQQPQQEQPAEPDPETDPIGALKAAREQQRMLMEHMAQQQHVAQLQQVAYQAATQYKAQVPDYPDAYQYALNSRAQELMALGTPQHAIGQILQREELSLIDTAVRNGRNPADAIYQFARARGFQGKTAAPAPTPAQPTVDPALQQQKAAVAASASAGGAPASKGQMSLADIANLRGAAFDKAWAKVEEMSGKKSSIFRD